MIFFENEEKRFAVVGHKMDKSTSSIQSVGSDHIKGLWITFEKPLHQAKACGDFILPGLVGSRSNGRAKGPPNS